MLRIVIRMLPLLTLVGCNEEPEGPVPTSVSPNRGGSNQATPVEILGRNFHVVVEANFDDEESKVDKTFRAWLIGPEGAHAMGKVVFISNQKLTAEVPAGLAASSYGLELEDPRGQKGTLPDAFTVTGPADPDLGVDADMPDAGPDQALDQGTPDQATADLPAPDLLLPDMASDLPVPDLPLPDVAVPDLPVPDLVVSDSPQPDTGPAGGTVAQVGTNPLGDGTAFSFVFKYHDVVYLGPNKNGSGAVRLNPDGTSPVTVAFSFPGDTTGNSTQNSSAPPYPSVGRTGCQQDTYECGPDNEDGRGLFAAGTINGTEWLVVGGSKTGGDLEYVYMTADTDTTLDFRYVDLAALLDGGTKGISSMHAHGNRLYLGFPNTGAKRPFLVVLKTTPASPGLDVATNAEAEHLRADKMPGIGLSSGTSMIDAMGDIDGLIHIFNNGGCMRATKASPANYDNNPADWAVCTPATAAYNSKTAITTSKVTEIEPADKAWPQIATFQGRLYVGRNTTAGPQLWVCDPGATAGCDSGDWSLVAPNTAGDSLLTQFSNPQNTRISLVVATAAHLYVGFDNATDGVVVLRTATAATTTADFTGLAGCSGAAHPSGCAGLGGNGLGLATTNSRIFHATAMTFGGRDHVYIVAGNGTAPLSVYRIFD